MADSPSAEDAVRYHLTQPGVSFNGHVRRRIIELGETLSDRRAVYLDTCFWIHVRDAAMGRARRTEYVALLSVLRDKVATRQIFCPLNWASLVELLKQADSRCRDVTARLVDEIGLGVTVCDERVRIATELAYAVHRHARVGELHPLAHLVWTRVPYALGIQHPVSPALDEEIGRAVSKAFFDHLWNIRAADMIRGLVDPFPGDDLSGAAARLNRGIVDHVDQVDSYWGTYLNEVAGVLDLHADVVVAVIEEMFQNATGQSAGSTPESLQDTRKECFKRLIAIAESGQGGRAFPTLHAYAKLHAAIRWDKGRRLDGNTLYDLHHAAAAVAYCDAFFTDSGMRTLLTQSHVALDREFGCFVASDPAEVLNALTTDTWLTERPSRYGRDG